MPYAVKFDHRGIAGRRSRDPSADVFRAEQAAYVAALRATGAEVTVLPADEAFPDSVLIEDAALCLKGQAIVLRPDLARIVNGVIDLKTSGNVDGGLSCMSLRFSL